MSTPTLLSKDLTTLKSWFSKHAPTCVHKPEGMLKYEYVTPTAGVVAGGDDKSDVPERSTVGHYLQMYDWDACFFSQVAHKVGIKGLPANVVRNFLGLKQADGFVPRTVSPARIWDAGDMCKPFLAQTLHHALESKQFNDTAALPSLSQDLDCYIGYFLSKRRHKNGLCTWRNVLESGVDDNLALIAPREAAKDEDESVSELIDHRLLAADLNSYLAAECASLSRIADKAGNVEMAQKAITNADTLAKLIDEHLWNDRLEMYCNLDPKTGKHIEIRAWTGLVPALLGHVNEERIERVIRKNILSEQHFLRPYGIASAAASEPLYSQSKRGMYGRAIVSHWQGPMWVLPNALVVRCLTSNGFAKEAKEIAQRCLAALCADLKNSGTLHENYDAETNKPLWAPNFMSWNILALELIELVE